MKKNKFYILVTFVYLSLRLVGLGSDITNSDAIRWHRRSINFLNSVKQHEFISTYQHYQPGVILMWLTSITEQGLHKYQQNYTDQYLSLEHSGWYKTEHAIDKAALVLVLASLFIIQLVVTSKLFGKSTALFYGLFVATEPYLVGIDRWFHLTSLETYFGFTALLILLLWKQSMRAQHHSARTRHSELVSESLLVVSALLFAAAVYSKLTALIISPVLFIIIFKQKDFKKNLVVFGLVCLGFFILALPALWVDPIFVLQQFKQAIFGAVSGDIRIDQLNSVTKFMFYPFVLFFRFSPMFIFLLLLSILNYKKIKEPYLFLYFAIYFLVLCFSDKKIDRYSIALFLPLILIVARFVSSLYGIKKWLICFAVFISSLFVVKNYHPVYSAYYSPLFGGMENALNIGVFENSGEFYAQAAQYLNEKQGRPLVYVPNNIDSFAFHYSGDSTQEFSEEVSYIVWSYDIDRTQMPAYEGCAVEETFGAKNYSYVYIFSCK